MNKMVIIKSDKKTRNIKLTENEIQLIVEELERIPHNVYQFLNFEKIIEKLNGDKNE